MYWFLNLVIQENSGRYKWSLIISHEFNILFQIYVRFKKTSPLYPFAKFNDGQSAFVYSKYA
jgi:hypothetical protein